MNATRWSAGVYQLLDLPAEHLTPSLQLFMSFVHAGDRVMVDAVLDGGKTAAYENLLFRIVRRDGSVRLVSAVALEASDQDIPDRLCLFDHSASFDAGCDSTGLRGELMACADHVSAGLWAFGDAAGLVGLSRIARDTLGFGSGERPTLGQIARQVHPEERELFLQLAGSPQISNAIEKAEIRYTRPGDGHVRRLKVTFAADLDSRGVELRRWGTVTDVTDDAILADKSRDAGAILSGCLDHVSDGIMVLDRHGRLEVANTSATSFLQADLTGKVIWEALPALIGGRLWRIVQEVAERGSTVEEEALVPPFGKWLAYSVSRIPEGRILVTFRSCDEEHRIKAIFRELSERCSTAFRWGNLAIWELDVAAGRLWLADATRGLVGAGIKSLGAFRDTVLPEDLPALDAAIREAALDGHPFEANIRVVQGEGRVIRLRVRGGVAEGALNVGRRLAGVAIVLDDADIRRSGQWAAAPPVEIRNSPLTGGQVRAARGALRWSVRELSERSEVSVATINRFEAGSKTVNARDRSISALHRVLVRHGIEFFVTASGHPAVAMTGAEPVAGGTEDPTDLEAIAA